MLKSSKQNKKKATKAKKVGGRKKTPPPPAVIPDEINRIWNTETEDAWNKLTEIEKAFFLQWVRNGYNGRKAWQNLHPNADVSSCRASASSTLNKPHFVRLREQLAVMPDWHNELADQIILDAMHSDDENIRLRAAMIHKEEYKKAISKLAPKGKEEDEETVVQKNVNVIVAANMSALKDLLNGG